MMNFLQKIWNSGPLSKRDPLLNAGRVNLDGYLQQAEAALRARRPKEAIKILSRAIAIAPAVPALRYNLALAQQSAGQPAASAASFRMALMLAPGSLPAMGGLSAALEDLGRWHEANNMRAGAALTQPVVHRVPNAPPRTIVLTIDDGPSPESTPAVLSILNQANVRASFFITGERAERNPELVRAIAASGHDICNHGYSHSHLDNDFCDLKKELTDTEAQLSRHRPPPSPYWIRLPYGSGWFDPAIHKRLREWNREAFLVQWTRSFFEREIAESCTDMTQLRSACGKSVRNALKIPSPAGTIFLIHHPPLGMTSAMASQACVILLEKLLQGLAARNLKATSLSRIFSGQLRGLSPLHRTSPPEDVGSAGRPLSISI